MRTLAIALWMASVSAHAAGPIDAGARLAATCTACHGPASVAGNALPPLTGQSQEALLASLRAFKAGTRPATIMTQLAKGYTDEQLALVAAWFAQAPAAPVTTPPPLSYAPPVTGTYLRVADPQIGACHLGSPSNACKDRQ